MYFEIYLSSDQYLWRLKAANREIIAHGEAYKKKQDCLHAIGLIMEADKNTPTYDETYDETCETYDET